jgi:hypothetical protein
LGNLQTTEKFYRFVIGDKKVKVVVKQPIRAFASSSLVDFENGLGVFGTE